MKNKLLSISVFFLFCGFSLKAQTKFDKTTTSGDNFQPKNFYFSICTGINSNTGIIGIQLEEKIADHFSVYGGVGVGTWGNKLTVGARYYFTHPLGSAFGLSFSDATGLRNRTANIPVVLSNGSNVNQDVTYDLKSISVINFSWLKYWKMGKKSRFNLEIGYSISLSPNVESNVTLHDQTITLAESSKTAFRILQPGGLLVGIGFNF